ncbi:MAG: enolase C-terminal domain-like protein [Candidatus Sericytochromatia bacterium]|nr:enolase C-terminal domain-like protein [Candidatus Sericytochromatia bacterium]
MSLVGLDLHLLGIPFVESFSHSASDRAFSDTVLVRVTDAEGRTGWGEGIARAYVTGETPEGLVAHLAERLWPLVAGRPLPELRGPEDLLALEAWLPDLEEPGVVAAHGARCALELAVLDLVLRRQGMPASRLLPPARQTVTYSGVITAGDPARAAVHARQMKLVGLREVKVKVGDPDDLARVAAVRQIWGEGVALRLDANAAWDLETAVARLQAMACFGPVAVEQPLPRGRLADWQALRARVPVPVMVDESLVTVADAEALIHARATDMFNVRVSKNGGLARAWRIANLALRAGLRVQVGAQVGETALLSAAGRHLAAALPELAHAEGSFGTLLLTEDVSASPVKFGHRGEAPLLRGHGLGVVVAEDRVGKYTRLHRHEAAP